MSETSSKQKHFLTETIMIISRIAYGIGIGMFIKTNDWGFSICLMLFGAVCGWKTCEEGEIV